MQTALVYTWSRIVPGHEKLAVEKWRSDSERLRRYQEEGRIDGFSWYLDTQGTGGLLVVTLDSSEVSALADDEEGLASRTMSAVIAEDFRWSIHAAGESVDAFMGLYDATVDRLAGAR